MCVNGLENRKAQMTKMDNSNFVEVRGQMKEGWISRPALC